jgi:hypothetical protein
MTGVGVWVGVTVGVRVGVEVEVGVAVSVGVLVGGMGVSEGTAVAVGGTSDSGDWQAVIINIRVTMSSLLIIRESFFSMRIFLQQDAYGRSKRSSH